MGEPRLSIRDEQSEEGVSRDERWTGLHSNKDRVTWKVPFYPIFAYLARILNSILALKWLTGSLKELAVRRCG